jgi:acetolactate synthase-1/2/3 large subunit
VKNTARIETVAEAFLTGLKERGIDHFYVNAGTDFASLVEAYSRQPASGLDFPDPVICPHENLAVGMAHGYTMVTGKPQAVMCHVTVGAANAVCNLMNAARDAVPMVFCAGRTPLFEKGRQGARNLHIHWAQEMFDQGGMLRELVKWDYELRDGLNLDGVLGRAIGIASAAPQGPVYLMLPREVMAQPLSLDDRAEPLAAIPTEPAPDPAAVDRLAAMIAAAQFPLIITSASGRAPLTVSPLAALCERFAIGVVEHRSRYVCLPSSHALHLGYESAPVLDKADLILVVETDVPWFPQEGEPRPGTRIVNIGVDPLFSDYPIRGFDGELAITTSVARLLGPLAAALARETAGRAEAIAGRRAAIAELAAARRRRNAAQMTALGAAPRMTKAWLNHCLNRAKPAEAIIVNEYWANRELLDFEEPGSYFQHSPAGGLGWGLPAALGAAQAAPDRPVIATLGDGAYIFANPAACHQVAQARGLPVLMIVCNNSHWGAVESSALGVYPDGHAAARRRGGHVPLSDLSPSPDFEKYAQASGGYGERVSDPAALPEAIARALAVVRDERRQALLNVVCE